MSTNKLCHSEMEEWMAAINAHIHVLYMEVEGLQCFLTLAWRAHGLSTD